MLRRAGRDLRVSQPAIAVLISGSGLAGEPGVAVVRNNYIQVSRSSLVYGSRAFRNVLFLFDRLRIEYLTTGRTFGEGSSLAHTSAHQHLGSNGIMAKDRKAQLVEKDCRMCADERLIFISRFLKTKLNTKVRTNGCK